MKTNFEPISELLTSVHSRVQAGDATQVEDSNDLIFAAINDTELQISWRMWYGNDGITLDRQLLLLQIGNLECAFCFGSALMHQSVKLLASLSPRWRDHFSCIHGLHNSNIWFTGVISMVESSVGNQWSQVIVNLIGATTDGLINWGMADRDCWVTECDSHKISIELLTPVDETDRPIPYTLARMNCGPAHTVICAGTQTMFLLRELLARIDPNWRLKVEIETRELRDLLNAFRIAGS